MTADLILHNGHFTTLDRSNPVATAVAISDGKFVAAQGQGLIDRLAQSEAVLGRQGSAHVLLGELIDVHRDDAEPVEVLTVIVRPFEDLADDDVRV